MRLRKWIAMLVSVVMLVPATVLAIGDEPQVAQVYISNSTPVSEITLTYGDNSVTSSDTLISGLNIPLGVDVTMVVTPEKGYEVDSISNATKVDANTYTFTTPTDSTFFFITIVCKKEIVTTGSCGEHLTYEFTSTNDDGKYDKLTITGYGPMTDYLNGSDSPFSNKDDLTSIEFVNEAPQGAVGNVGIESIGKYAFYNCKGITSISIPDTVKTIGPYSFNECKNLETVTLPSNGKLSSIGDCAFGNCTKLCDESGNVKVSVPSFVTSIGVSAFDGDIVGSLSENISYKLEKDDNFKTIIFSGTGVLGGTSYSMGAGYPNSANIENIVIEEGVTEIGANTFANMTNIKTVTLPSTLTTIGDRAFYGCTSLTTVTGLSKSMSVDINTFTGCTALDADTVALIPDITGTYGTVNPVTYQITGFSAANGGYQTMNITGSGVIDDCAQMPPFMGSPVTVLNIDSGITGIGMGVFANMTNLSTVVLGASGPDAATVTIGERAFYGDTNLSSLTVLSNDFTFALTSFYGCSKLKLPSTATATGVCGDNLTYTATGFSNGAFDNGYGNPSPFEGVGVTNLVLESGVTSVGDYAFQMCSTLESVTFPDTLVKIGSHAFYNCSSLSGELVFPVTFKSIGDSAFAHTAITGAKFPESIDSFGEGVFDYCKSLQAAVLPLNLTRIPASSFSGCSALASVNIPDGVTEIGNSAFYGCTSLFGISIPDVVNTISRYAFTANNPIMIRHTEGSNVLDIVTDNGTITKSSNGWMLIFTADEAEEDTMLKALIGDDNGALLYGHSLTLDGTIGINFYMDLSAVEGLKDTDYMEFLQEGRNEPVRIPVSDAVTKTLKGKEYTVFTYRVTAKEMADDITAHMVVDNVVGMDYTYSVKDYAEYILKNKTYSDHYLSSLIISMLFYGAKAQEYFDYNTEHMANQWLVDEGYSCPYSESTDNSINGYGWSNAKKISSFANLPSDIRVAGSSLVLLSETTLNIYIGVPSDVIDSTLDDHIYTFSVEGKEIKKSESQGYLVLSVPVNASEICSWVTVNINNGEYFFKYSPLSYSYMVINGKKFQDETVLKELMRAFYEYGSAAGDYADNHSGL